MQKSGYVYLMTNRKNGTLYTGSTSNLVQRIYQHREELLDGFTKDRGCKKLVWFENHDDLQEARRRELLIKKWHRPWKIRLIQECNPDWKDLWFEIVR